MKKLITIVLVAILTPTMTISLTACTPADYTIGIAQYVTIDALDNATQGFKDTLDKWATDNQLTINYIEQNAAASVDNATTIANNMVARNVDLIFANATPCATAAVAARLGQDIPIMYTSVTDPQQAGLVDSDNVYGVNDLNPVAEQVQLIREIRPTASKIAVLYTSSEENSIAQCQMVKQYCQSLEVPIEVEEITVSTSSEIPTVLNAKLVGDHGIDAIYVPTDNNVASAMGTVANITNEKQVLTVAGEAGMVVAGAVATQALDYYQLGVQTALIAIDVLQGNTVQQPHQSLTKFSFAINQQSALAIGMTQQQIEQLKAKYQ